MTAIAVQHTNAAVILKWVWKLTVGPMIFWQLFFLSILMRKMDAEADFDINDVTNIRNLVLILTFYFPAFASLSNVQTSRLDMPIIMKMMEIYFFANAAELVPSGRCCSGRNCTKHIDLFSVASAKKRISKLTYYIDWWVRDTCALPLTYRTNFFSFRTFFCVREFASISLCLSLYNPVYMRRRHRWALSTTEFIMFAFLLLHSELMFVGEIRIVDENLCSPVVFFSARPSSSRNRARMLLHIYLQFYNLHVHHQLLFIYLLSYRASSC